MGLIKRADIEQYTRDAYVMDLSDLEKRGRCLVDAANAEAARILAEANQQRAELVSKGEADGRQRGFDEGFAQGLQEGAARGTEEARQQQSELLGQLALLWTSQLDAFEQQRDAMLEAARTQIVELGVMIARRVTRRAIELDPAVVAAQMDAVLSSVTESTRLVLRVHPRDVEIAQSELPALIERFSTCEHAQIVTDASLEPGSCVGRTSSGGVIDASISMQLDRIIDALLPGGEPASEPGKIGVIEPARDQAIGPKISQDATDDEDRSQEDAA